MPPINPGEIHLENDEGQTLLLPSTVTMTNIQRSWRRVEQTVLYRPGTLMADRGQSDALSFNLSGQLNAVDAAGARDKLGELARLLDYGPVKVRRFGAADTRWLVAYATTLSRTMQMVERFGTLDLPMRAPDPFWQAAEATDSASFASSGATDTLTNNGDAQTYPVLEFTVTAGATDVVVRNLNNGTQCTLQGTFAINDVLTMDSGRVEVKKNGAVDLTIAGSDFLLAPIILEPGVNTFQVSASGTVSGTLALTYTPRWY